MERKFSKFSLEAMGGETGVCSNSERPVEVGDYLIC